MKQAVFFDIDGTLWNQHMQIPDSTVSAIRKLREAGHATFICSGRSRANIRSKNLLDIGFDGVVAACGTHIDFHKETIFEVLLKESQVAHSLKVFEDYHMPVVLEGPQYIYVRQEDFLLDPYVKYLRNELGEDLKEIYEDTSKIVINKMSAEMNQASIEEVRQALGAEFDLIVHEGEKVLEMIPAGYSKATGIQKVCEILNIPWENTYAFGDSENDLDMLEYVAHGIAMGNGTPNAKKAAEFVTTDIEEDGIQNGLLHYGLIS